MLQMYMHIHLWGGAYNPVYLQMSLQNVIYHFRFK